MASHSLDQRSIRADLAVCADTHTALCDQLFDLLVKIAAVENRTNILLDRLNDATR